jgi:phosphate:Na+ symporter
VALGHIAFNVITAILALMILPFLIYGIRKAGAILHLPGSTEATLALFHTAFNLLGLLILFPFIDQIAAFLNRRFRSSDEDMAQPVFLDKTLHQMPILAISALLKESTRLQQLSENLILDAFLADRKKPDGLAKEAQALKVLGTAISEVPGQLNTASLSMESTGDISQILRTTRYLQDAVSLAPRIAGIQGKITGLKDDQTRQLCCATLDEAKKTIKAGQESPQNTSALIEALQQFENSYRDTKAALLENAARGLIDIERLQSILDNLSQLRRLVQQMSKASRTLNIITNKNSEQGA